MSNEALLFSKMGIYLCSKILVPESGPDEPACRVGIETQTEENRHMDTKGKGEGRMHWKTRTDMYTLHVE